MSIESRWASLKDRYHNPLEHLGELGLVVEKDTIVQAALLQVQIGELALEARIAELARAEGCMYG